MVLRNGDTAAAETAIALSCRQGEIGTTGTQHPQLHEAGSDVGGLVFWTALEDLAECQIRQSQRTNS